MTGTWRKITTPPEQQQLTQVAQQQQALAGTEQQQGQTLIDSLIKGQLPPGQQASVDLALNNALAGVRGRFASLGLPGSSMEQEAVAYQQLQSAANAAEIERAMAQLGVSLESGAGSALGGASQTFQDIAQNQSEFDKALNSAISGFTGALGRGTVSSALGGVGGGGGGGAAAGTTAGAASDAAGTGLAGSQWALDLTQLLPALGA